MAQPRQSEPVVIGLVPTPHEAPPPYEEVSPPSPPTRTYYSSRPHRCENCGNGASPPSYHAPSRPAPQRPVNPVENLYSRINSCNFAKWGMAMICLVTSAAVLRRFPASSLRPVLIYLISISALHFFCPALPVRPFSTTTARPPLWHFFALAISTAMWGAGAVAVLVVYHRDSKAAIPRGDGAEESERADRWENAVIIAGVSGIFALITCLWQWLNTVRLCRGFFQSDIREGYKRMWGRKEIVKEWRAARRAARRAGRA